MADDDEERRSLVLNEQLKLRATLLNTVAAGFVIAGIVTPLVSIVIAGNDGSSGAILLMIVWFLLAVSLHYAAIFTLERLR